MPSNHPDLDPHRLIVAAHELGHAIAWKASGLDIAEIWIKGSGPAAHGHVWIVQTETDIRTVADELAVHTGLLAGRIAEDRWCNHATITSPFTCATDETLYRARRRTPLGRQISRAAATTAARNLIRTHWTAITRLTPVLARTGHLPPTACPPASNRHLLRRTVTTD